MPTWQPKTWRWWYGSIADWMIENPGGTQKQLAAELGVSAQIITYIVSSDLFKAHYAKRRAEIETGIRDKVISGASKLADKTTEIMLDTLTKKRDAIPIEVLNDIRTSALDQLGFGKSAVPQVQINQTTDRRVMVAVDSAALLEAREAIRQAERNRQLAPPSQRLMPEPALLGARIAPQLENDEDYEITIIGTPN